VAGPGAGGAFIVCGDGMLNPTTPVTPAPPTAPSPPPPPPVTTTPAKPATKPVVLHPGVKQPAGKKK
ncbi:MAG: hypothetical protein QOD65_31, partial [Gaiellales bacterium]|nr:hypothetical protein [Gaiellales bacterium]